MFSLRRFRHILAVPLIAAMAWLNIPLGVAQAAMVGSDSIVASESANADRQTVDAFLQRQDVSDQLKAWGVDPSEARDRVAALSDAEVARIAKAMPNDPAGQGAVGAVVGAALIIFLVLLITDLLGLTKVFPFTRSAH